MVEQHVLPHLLRAHTAKVAEPAPSGERISDLADLAAHDDLTAALALVDALMSDGLSFEGALLDLVAPAARELGHGWNEDDRSFADVTVGLGVLRRLVARLGERAAAVYPHRGAVVFWTPPGEQHTLGVAILGAVVRADGWDTTLAVGWSSSELVEHVSRQPHMMVGLATPRHSAPERRELTRLIETLKTRSSYRPLLVALGGTPDLADQAATLGAVYCGSGRELRALLQGLGRDR
ncbi:MAG: hypothetical protein AAF447_01705 [Myxococcota bacterium]